MNIYDFLATKHFNVDVADKDKRPVFKLVEEARVKLSDFIENECSTDMHIRIGLQLKASTPVRTPSLDVWTCIIEALAQGLPGSKFFLIVRPFEDEICKSLVERLSGFAWRIRSLSSELLTTDDLFAAVSCMDLVISPDSSVIHIAAGLDIPSIGLYGPFPSKLRISSYENCMAVEPVIHCAPCFLHVNEPCPEARKLNRVESPCFDLINPDHVVLAARKLLVNCLETES